MYTLSKKLKSKWYAVAQTDGTCLADGKDKLNLACGVDHWDTTHKVHYTKQIENAKNYGGKLHSFKVI